MKANFRLVNKYKRTSERMRVLQHKAPTIDNLLFTRTQLINTDVMAILFKENFFMAVAIINTVVIQVVKHQIKGFGEPRHPLRDLKSRESSFHIVPSNPSDISIIKRLNINNKLINFSGQIT